MSRDEEKPNPYESPQSASVPNPILDDDGPVPGLWIVKWVVAAIVIPLTIIRIVLSVLHALGVGVGSNYY